MTETTGNWDTKIQLAIRFPSQADSEDDPITVNIMPIESINIRQNIEQTTINTIGQAHIGFSTAMGEFTGSFRIYETSTNMAMIDEIKAKNRYFDIVITENDDAELQQDWKVTSLLLIGCKLTGDEKSYTYGRIPLRSYNFKFLRSADSEIGKDGASDFTIDFGNGLFNVKVNEEPRDSSNVGSWKVTTP